MQGARFILKTRTPQPSGRAGSRHGIPRKKNPTRLRVFDPQQLRLLEGSEVQPVGEGGGEARDAWLVPDENRAFVLGDPREQPTQTAPRSQRLVDGHRELGSAQSRDELGRLQGAHEWTRHDRRGHDAKLGERTPDRASILTTSRGQVAALIGELGRLVDGLRVAQQMNEHAVMVAQPARPRKSIDG